MPDFDEIEEKQFEETVKLDYTNLNADIEDEPEEESLYSMDIAIKSRNLTHDSFFNMPCFEPEHPSHIEWVDPVVDGPNFYDFIAIGSNSSSLELAH